MLLSMYRLSLLLRVGDNERMVHIDVEVVVEDKGR